MQRIFKKYDISVNDLQVAKFQKFLVLFQDWNSKINLSAIRKSDDIIVKHFIDSLLILKHFNLKNKKIMDLGTGGGFPAIPLAIMLDSSITAIDSKNKKLKVVNDIAINLNLNIETIHSRAEDLAKDKKYSGQFDIVVTRAFAKWPILLKLSLPFVKKGGSLIAYQGPSIHSDLKEYFEYENQFGGKLKTIIEAKLEDATRVFIEVLKII